MVNDLVFNNCDSNGGKIVLIRHGITKSNSEQRYLGWTDEPLSGIGVKKLEEARKPGFFCDEAFVLFVSPMLRCWQTADIMFPDKEQVIIDNFKEMNFGEFELKNYKELSNDPRYQAYIDSGGETAFPGGECKTDFIKRCMEGYDSALQYMKEHNLKNAVMVVHAGTIMAILSSIKGGHYFDYHVDYGCCIEM